MRTALYRHFNKEGILIYVGIAEKWGARQLQHESKSPWFHESESLKVIYFDTREEALDAEKSVIINEKPLYNKQHNTSPIQMASRRTQFFERSFILSDNGYELIIRRSNEPVTKEDIILACEVVKLEVFATIRENGTFRDSED